MDYKLLIRPFATIEINEAYDWYELQQYNLGERFLQELELVFNKIITNPYIFSYINAPIRQALVKNFPYQVVYEIFDNELIVYSVFMAMQNPNKKRLF